MTFKFSSGYAAGAQKHGVVPYHAKAVHFDGNATLTINGGAGLPSSTSQVTFAAWVRGDWTFPGLDNDYFLYGSALDNQNQVKITDQGPVFFAAPNLFAPSIFSSEPTDNNWHFLLQSFSLNFTQGNKLWAIYLDGVKLSADSITDTGDGIVLTPSSYNDWAVCASSEDDPSTVGDFADVMVWLDLSIVQNDLTINPGDIANFMVDGKPVNPAVAIAAYGQPDFLFSGDHTTFPVNQGTGGAFTLTGALTNASPPP